jgi:hypothetical protein
MRDNIKLYLSYLVIALMFTGGCALEDVTKNGDSGDLVAPGGKNAPPEIANEIYRARDSILVYFSPLSGTVEDIGDGVAKIRLEKDVQIKRGMRFSVYRESSEFYHPVTNELIGGSDEFVGRVEVEHEDAGDGLYLCTIIKGDIRVGDKVRITSSKIKLSFFQDRKADWAISDAFYRSLNDSGRFEILESYTPNYEPNALSELARDLDAEAVLMFSTPVKDEKRFLNIKLYWAEDVEMFGEIEEVAGHNLAKMLASEEEFIPTSLTSMEPWENHVLSEGQLIAMGDVDGNGIKELAISNGRDIKIYSLKEELQEIWFIEGSPEDSHLSLDILDLNNNGMAEIFVTSIVNSGKTNKTDGKIYSDDNRISSYVIEYDGSEGYRKIRYKMPYFMRVIGKTLLMQRSASHRIFSGPVYEGEWDEGHYQPEEPLKLPAGVNIYGFTFVDWKDDGQSYLMTFDDNGYLYLYDDNGNIMWKSSKSYGQFPFSFVKRTYSMVNTKVKVSIRGRLISVKTERGQEIIVVKKNPVLQGVPGLGVWGADVYSLWWDNGVMTEKLIKSEVSGTVTDYWVEGKELFLIAGGNLISLIENATSGEFSKGSILYYYSFGEK